MWCPVAQISPGHQNQGLQECLLYLSLCELLFWLSHVCLHPNWGFPLSLHWAGFGHCTFTSMSEVAVGSDVVGVSSQASWWQLASATFACISTQPTEPPMYPSFGILKSDCYCSWYTILVSGAQHSVSKILCITTIHAVTICHHIWLLQFYRLYFLCCTFISVTFLTTENFFLLIFLYRFLYINFVLCSFTEFIYQY